MPLKDRLLGRLSGDSGGAKDGPDAWRAKGLECARRGDDAQACGLLQRAVRAGDDRVETHRELGRALNRLARHAEAVPHLRRAVELASGDYAAQFELGRAQMKLGEAGGAVTAFSAAVAARPDKAAGHHELGRAYTRAGDHAQAAAQYRRALEIDPDRAVTHRELGRALRRLGQDQEATASLRRATTQDPEDVESYLELARTALGRGDAGAALDWVSRAAELRPEDPEVHLSRGRILARRGEHWKACASFRDALRQDPGLAVARHELGRTLSRLGRHEEAVAEYRQALEQTPDDHRCRFELGRALARLGELDAAETELRRAIELEPNHKAGYHELGKVLVKSSARTLEAALEQFYRALEHDPDDPEVQQQVARTLERLGRRGASQEFLAQMAGGPALGALDGDPDGDLAGLLDRGRRALRRGEAGRACELLAEAERLAPRDFRAPFELGRAWLKAGQPDRAVEALKRAVALNPGHAPGLHELGRAHLRGEQREAAAAAFRRALELDPARGVTHHELARAHAGLGAHDEAIASFRRALELDPEATASRFGLARELIKSGDPEAAVDELARVVREDPDSYPARFELGRIQLAAGEIDAAIATLARAVELDPHKPLAYHELGRAHLRRREPTEAAGWFRRALEVEPGRVPTRHELGRALAAAGELEQAREELLHVLELAPENHASLHELGRVFTRLGRHEDARQHFEEVLSLAPEHAPSLHELALLELRDGQREAALERLEQAIAAAPEREAYLLERARVHVEGGQLDLALADAERAAGIAPESTKTALLLDTLRGLAGLDSAAAPGVTAILDARSAAGAPAGLLEALRGQSYDDLEILIVEAPERSADPELVGARDHRIAVPADEPAALRAIIERATGDWILLPGSGDDLAPDAVERLVGGITARAGTVVLPGASTDRPAARLWRRELLLDALAAWPEPAPPRDAAALTATLAPLAREIALPPDAPDGETPRDHRPLVPVAPALQGRVLLISSSGIALFGGVEHFLRTMVEVYRGLGLEVVIVGMKAAVNGEGEGEGDGFRFRNIEPTAAALCEVILAERPALVHATTGVGYDVAEAARFLRVPVIYGTHFWRDMFQGKDWFADVDRVGRPRFDFHHLLQAVAVHYANSRYMQAVTAEHFEAVPPVVYSLPGEPAAPPAPVDEREYVLLVNARQEKGFGLLLDLAESLPDLPFVAIAGQSPRSEAVAAVERRGLGNVRVLERTEDMDAVYRRARVVLVPSYAFVETFSRVVIEAHRHGVPVVGSDRGNVPLLLAESGVALPEDPPAWAEEIRRLYADPDYYAERCAGAEANSARYPFARQHERVGRLVAAAARPVLVGVGSGIGNIIQVTPMIRVLSEALGQPVDVVIREDFPGCGWLLAGAPWVSQVFTLGPDVVRRHYDLVFLTDSFGDVIPPFASPDVRVTRRHYPFSLCQEMHETEFNLHCLERMLGIPVPEGAHRSYFLGDFEYSPPGRKRVGLHAGGKAGVWARKRWPYFAELAGRLAAAGCEVMSFGGPDELVPGTVDRTGTPLRESIRNILDCDLFVANDSGLMHVADAVGLPLVTFFGPTSVTKNGPLAATSTVVRLDRDCAPCQFDPRFKDCREDCMAELSLDEVWAVVEAKLVDG